MIDRRLGPSAGPACSLERTSMPEKIGKRRSPAGFSQMRFRLRTLMGLAAIAAIFLQAAVMIYERWTTKPLTDSIAEFNTNAQSPYLREFPLTEAEVISALKRQRPKREHDALSNQTRREILRTRRIPKSAKFSLIDYAASPDGKVYLLNFVKLQITLEDDTVRQLSVRKSEPRMVGVAASPQTANVTSDTNST